MLSRMKNLVIGFVGAMAAAAGALSGCGGGSGGGTCANGSACGGNIVGTWKIVSSCLSSSGSDPSCPTATSDTSGLKIDGTVTYDAAMTYNTAMTLSGTVKSTLPASCLMDNGMTITCAQLGAAFMAGAQDPDFPFSAASCTGSSSCTCTLTYKPISVNDMGTYITAGGLLTETDSSGDATQSDFCVLGSKLTESPHKDMTMPGMMGDVAVSGSITFSKQ
jgi:hypothetical protein